MAQKRGLYVGGVERMTEAWYEVRHKWSGDVLSEVAEAAEDDIELAVQSARQALGQPLSVHQRYRVLESAADRLGERRAEVAYTIAREAGKPLRDAQAEVDRGQQTLRYSALAARTLRGEEVPVRGNPGSEARIAFTLRKPYGVVLAITPFNFPLNLALHKIGPALASGNAVVLKPAPKTPLTALMLARIFQDAGLPPGWLNVVTGAAPQVGARLVEHPGVDMVSFTGSAAVGQAIRQSAGLKPVLLELGGNAANIVHHDADLSQTSSVLAKRAYAYAGQVCISVQRIYVHQDIYADFMASLAKKVRALRLGSPEEVTSDLGPMISRAAADRATAWVQDALREGARPVVEGRQDENKIYPWLLDRVPETANVIKEEVFAPVAVVSPYHTIDQAVTMANHSRYGLQAGLFTESMDVAFYVAQHLEVGGLVVNDSSSYRADNMPYGGVKDSGIGREGPEYAVYEMTYPTVVVLNLHQ